MQQVLQNVVGLSVVTISDMSCTDITVELGTAI